jgi:hypothetical protein
MRVLGVRGAGSLSKRDRRRRRREFGKKWGRSSRWRIRGGKKE